MGKQETAGQLVDQLFEVREEIRKLNKQAEALSENKTALELRLIEAMEAQDLEQLRGSKASATLTKPLVPQVKDWEKFYTFINKFKMPYLLEKRVSVKIFQELLENRKGKPLPGVDVFEKKTISLRTTNQE